MENIGKRYMSVGYWVDKASKKPMTRLAPIQEGVSKAGAPYGITDTENAEMVEGTIPLGTILAGTMTLTPETNGKTSSNLKINPNG